MNSISYKILERISELCTECRECRSACRLLSQLEDFTPGDMARQFLSGKVDNKIKDFFLRCDLCGLCINSCQMTVDIPDMVMAARQSFLKNGTIDPDAFRPIWVDHDWNSFTLFRRTYNIDYSDLEKKQCDAVFFPGCTVSCAAPALIRSVVSWLSEHYGNVGLLPMCCGLPLRMIGELERAEQYENLLWQTVDQKKARRIIASCPNCYRHLHNNKARRDIEVTSLYQLMAETGVKATAFNRKKLTLHDSCSDRAGNIGRYVRTILSAYEIVPMLHSGANTICCGSGGMVSTMDPELCMQRAKRRLHEFADTGADMCVTYCMSCANRLTKLAQPGQVRDILEIIFNQTVDYSLYNKHLQAMWQGESGGKNTRHLENSCKLELKDVVQSRDLKYYR